MITGKNYSFLCILLLALLINGHVFAADSNAKTGNKNRGDLTNGALSDAVSVDENRRSDYPTGWYYYGNSSSDLYPASSVYEPYDDYVYSTGDTQAIALAPVSSPVYIEQESQQKTPSSKTNYWDYCPVNKGFYPYVSDCPVQWQKIDIQPLGQEPGYWYYCKDPAGYYPYVRTCNSNWQKIIPY